MKKAESVSWSKLDIPKEIITKEEETQDNSKGAENQVQIGNTQGDYSQGGEHYEDWRVQKIRFNLELPREIIYETLINSYH